MKKLMVAIQAEFEVPDSWELVNHPDDIKAIKVSDGCYMDMSFCPFITADFTKLAQWTNDVPYALSQEINKMLESEDVVMKLSNSK